MAIAADSKQSSLMLALLPLGILYLGSIALLALTHEDAASALPYWTVFVPLVALISLITGWGTAYARDQSRLFYLIKQLLSWGFLLGLLWMLQIQGFAATLGTQKETIAMLYLLALTSLLIGLQIDWKLFIFGAYLAFCTYILAAPANTEILQPIGKIFGIVDAQNKPLTMVIGAGLIALLISLFLLIYTRGAVMAKRARA